jgi:hypothetical protein
MLINSSGAYYCLRTSISCFLKYGFLADASTVLVTISFFSKIVTLKACLISKKAKISLK